MEVNQDILNAFQKLSASQQSELQSVVEEYKAACDLAHGPNPSRSKHWKIRAWNLEESEKEVDDSLIPVFSARFDRRLE